MRRISTLITVTSAKKGFSNFPKAHKRGERGKNRSKERMQADLVSARKLGFVTFGNFRTVRDLLSLESMLC